MDVCAILNEIGKKKKKWYKKKKSLNKKCFSFKIKVMHISMF
jgi:hypothetical protein